MNSVIHKMLGVPIGMPNFSVSMKCDPLVIGSAIAAGAGLLGSLIGGNQQRKAVREQNATNLEIARQTNATNMRMADENNKMQWQMMMENNAFNKEQAIDMFNRENAYNAPLQQVSRLRAAGLNPANVLNSGGASVSGQADGSTPQAASSGITPTMPNLVTPHVEAEPSNMTATIQNLSTLAGAIGQIATAKNQNSQARATIAKLQPEIDKLIADKNSVEAEKAYKDSMTMLNRDYIPQKILSEVRVNYQQASLYALQGETEKAEASLKRIQSALGSQQYSQQAAQFPLVMKQLRESITLLGIQQKHEEAAVKSEIAGANASNAAAIASNAAAGKSRAETKTENELRPFVVNRAKRNQYPDNKSQSVWYAGDVAQQAARKAQRAKQMEIDQKAFDKGQISARDFYNRYGHYPKARVSRKFKQF